MSSGKRSKTTKNKVAADTLKSEKIAESMIKTGVVFVFASVLIFVAIFLPVLKEEFKYFSNNDVGEVAVVLESSQSDSVTEMVPVDKEFGIVIPKIRANAKIIEDVDPYNPSEYQLQLTKGIAHAKGTPVPGTAGNTFLFAHSSDNFYNANRYNSVFYLLHKLEGGDKFYIFKDHIKYEYEVTNKGIVDPSDVEYMKPTSDENKATLMTCWPPGTTLQRLIVEGKLVSVHDN